ncbi:AIPR family protein [Actinoplanes sp. ATCC 53533]|uniref:AIPR family protein n=1 Tax=Actinoplanes sp. ATCC 53533 TaxID=1288362 RepID=UPI0013154174|nr:AIPR family protein [Actinoplanes sp. ATCC 53533]
MDLVRGQVDRFRQEYGLEALKDDELFESFAAYCVVSQFVEESFPPDQLRTGRGGDLGIDARAILLNHELRTDSADVKEIMADHHGIDAHIVIVQAKRSTHFEGSVFTEIADNLIQIASTAEMTVPCSDDVRDLRISIRSVCDDPRRVRDGRPKVSVWYVTTGMWTGDAYLEAKRLAAAKRLTDTQLFRDVEVKGIGAQDLIRLDQRAASAASARITLTRKVTMPPVPGVKQAFLALLPAQELVNNLLTDDNGNMRRGIFEDNVRDFQQYDNRVNSEIQHTLENEVGRREFAVLNNGVTVVAQRVDSSGDVFDVRDYQIVNGCQTCHVLFDQRAVLDDSVFVSLRLIQSANEEVISRIVQATNQQTAVSEDDLAARTRFHRIIESYFAHQPVERRLYYERRAGMYTARTMTKTRIVTRSQVARAYAAMFIDGMVGVGVYSQLRRSHGDLLFQENHDPLPYYAGAAAYYRLEWLFRNRRLPSTYGPLRFHLLTGIRLALTGSQVPRDTKGLRKACKTIVDVVWNPEAAEDLVKSIIPSVHSAAGNGNISDAAHDKRFGESFQQAVLTGRQ